MQTAAIQVLLVEPDLESASLVKHFLDKSTRAQFSLTQVVGYEAALEATQEQHFDVWLVDVAAGLSPTPESGDGYAAEISARRQLWLAAAREHSAAMVFLVGSPMVANENAFLYGLGDFLTAADASFQYVDKRLFNGQILENVLVSAAYTARQHVMITRLEEENKVLNRVRQHLRLLLEEQEILRTVDRSIGYSIDIEHILNLAVDTAVRHLEAAGCVLAWIEPDTRQLRPLVTRGYVQTLTEPTRIDQLSQRGSPLAYIFEPRADFSPRLEEFAGRIILPLMVHDTPQGALVVEGLSSDQLRSYDLGFLKQLADRMAVALDNARMHRQARAYGEQMDRLYTVSMAVTSSLDEKEVLALSARGMAVLLNASSAFCAEFFVRQEKLVVQSTYIVEGMHENLPPPGAKFDMQKYPQLGGVLRSDPVPIRKGSRLIAEAERDLMELLGLQSVLIVPLITESELLGIIAVCESRYGRYWLPDEIALARSFGAQIVIAWQQARLFSSVQRLEQTKSEMIRMATHDLKNPLQQILGYIEVLNLDLPEVLNEHQKIYFGYIEEAAKRIEGLVQDILSLDQAESEAEAQWQEVELHKLVSEVCTSLVPQARLKRQDFQWELPQAGVSIRGSILLLRQALLNLIGNAIKYTPEEGAVVVQTRLDQRYFQFQVRDTGYGIPLEKQDRIFERFYRARAPGTDNIGGTGLGLSIVKTVIERHGGEVWFRSAAGVGSTFGFWLPLALQDTPHP